MTTLRYRFKINGIEVEEPTNWDSVEITVMRSENYHGLENIFSTALVFWNSGAQLLKSIYDQYGVDGEALFLIEYLCQDTYTTLFNGFLNLSTYSYSEGEVKLNFEDKSISRLFKNRLDTPINLDSNIGLDGQTLSTIPSLELGLHSKNILKLSKWDKPDDSINPYVYPPFNWTTANAYGVNIAFQNVVSEILESFSVISATPYLITSPSSIFNSGSLIEIQENGEFNVNIEADFDFNIVSVSLGSPFSTTIRYETRLHVYNGDGSLDSAIVLQTNDVPYSSDSNYTQNVSISYSNTGTFNAGQRVIIYFSGFLTSPLASSVELTITSDYATLNCEISQDTLQTPSTAKANLIFETLARVTESITGQNDILRSQIYGRTNSAPYAYSSNGIESWGAVTNGLNIRNMLDGNNQKLPIICKFSELFSSLDALHNIGCQIVSDGSLFRLEVEGKEYFYDKNTVIFSALNVDGLQRSVANDLYFSNISLGSEKWNLNQGQSNGRDEFNAVNNWYSPLKTIKNSFSKLSKFITSGYILEYTRRVQFSANPTTEYETDNDNFIIATNRNTVTSDKYSTDGSTQSYLAGTVSERNENFTTVNNVLSPDTCYNLRYSPFRRFAYWFKYVCAGIWKTPTVDISFQSGEANYLLETLLTSTLIDSTSGLHQENDPFNVLAPNQNAYPPYNIAQKTPLFIPEYIDFKYPVSFSEFISILANTKGVIQYSCNDSEIEKGFIKELKFTPNESGGECNFKLIRAFE
jgi:hypothetical protein